ncbi:pyridoxamine 5'-phosphate oxidase family protein [Candidatus Thalassolituus haligoni]|jgi:general stress protein 26|uniref:pyridoxamine 5'-phosphate oxidase family protein n=1 Tax=Candidatus Thalassolituus haligoni TaxID=3100113 RepID=UPI0035111A3B|tara:strand:- start:21006 stop:21509 length:504 start_codon:yes stop_codon:yes gene_type:complete
MKLIDKVDNEPLAALREQLQHESAVLLEVEGITPFMVPMAAQPDADGKHIWFFTSKDNELFGHLSGEHNARICISNGTENFWAQVNGSIKEFFDSEKVAEHWSVATESWFEQGKLDSKLTLLEFTVHEADISCSTDSSLTFGFETMKALVGDQDEPHISIHRHLVVE